MLRTFVLFAINGKNGNSQEKPRQKALLSSYFPTFCVCEKIRPVGGGENALEIIEMHYCHATKKVRSHQYLHRIEIN